MYNRPDPEKTAHTMRSVSEMRYVRFKRTQKATAPLIKAPTEHAVQVAYFDWVRMMRNSDPKYQMIFAIPNAGKRSYGAYRYYWQEGLERGVPDICIAIPKGFAHGAWIEFKRKPAKVRDDQLRWKRLLTDSGYEHWTCWSFEEAKQKTEEYLGRK